MVISFVTDVNKLYIVCSLKIHYGSYIYYGSYFAKYVNIANNHQYSY